MKTNLRFIMLVSGLTVALPALFACSDDAPKKVGDALAQDSTLNLAVMSANQDTMSPAETDSLAVAMDSLAPASGPARPRATSGTRSTSSPAISRTSVAATPDATPSPVQAPVRVAKAAASTTTRRVASKRSNAKRQLAVRTPAIGRSTRNRRVVSSPQGIVRVRRADRPNVASTSASTQVALGTGGSTIAESNPVAAAPAPVPSAPRSGIFLAGSELPLVAGQRICSYASEVGNQFGAVLSEAVVGTNGIVIPKGATAVTEITSIGTRKNDKKAIGLRVNSIAFGGRIYPVSSDVTYSEVESVVSRRRKTNAGTVAAGTGVGAILGAVVGGGAGGAVLGGVGGAAAGAAIGTRNTVRYEGCIPERGRITAILSQSLTI